MDDQAEVDGRLGAASPRTNGASFDPRPLPGPDPATAQAGNAAPLWPDRGHGVSRARERAPGRSLRTHLAALVLSADPDALSDLRARALAPLSGLRAGTADRLAETLRSWLLHQGRREQVAAHLVVHPQTVRYRMSQLRELYGARLDDPRTVLELTIALGSPPHGRHSGR